MRQTEGSDPVEFAGLQARLALALWQTGKDRPRATQLGHLARPLLVSADEHDRVAELDTWLPH